MSTMLSLQEAFEAVPDPRQASGRRYALGVVLTLAATAMLAGARSLYAIAQFGRDHGRRFAQALGFARGQTPCCTTLHYLFRALDVSAFERAIRCWAQARALPGGEALALDGKTLCGTTGVQLPGVHLLSAYAHQAGRVLGQVRVDAKTNEHKAALELLGLIPVAGAVLTGDALFCQKELSQEILRRGGDYVWTVKDNQPGLKADIALALAAAFSPAGTAVGGRGARRGRASRQRARAAGSAAADKQHRPDGLPRLAGRSTGVSGGA
jgi:hypothetical protein